MGTSKSQQGKRLGEMLRIMKLTQTEFAKRIGYNQSHISQMIQGKKAISPELLVALAENYKTVNFNWLIAGRGEMFENTNEHTENILKEPATQYNIENQMETVKELIVSMQKEIKKLKNE